jgi:hypothetical protein
MSERWTKGPWEIRKYTGPYSDHSLSVEIATDEIVIAKLGVEIDQECAANAHLIAAAPELYEALESLFRESDSGCECGTCGACRTDAQVLHALKKARGEA